MNHWHTTDIEQILTRFETDGVRGLSQSEAARRLAEYGSNELIEHGFKSPWRILAEQFTVVMVVILMVAAVISALLGDYTDAIAILAIVVLNALLGFRQEYKAERAMMALKKLAAPTVKVRRDGHTLEVSAREVTPGDVVLLEAGNLVPADGRLIESVNLRIQEAALTGESVPVEKTIQTLTQEDLSIGERNNLVFMGAIIVAGRGKAVVTQTGMQTELGRIASMLQAVPAGPTPLQQRLDRLGRRLAVVAIALVGVIFVAGLLRGEPVRQMFLTAVSLAVAAVPEGLPAVVTIALALGSQRMLNRRALIRKLPAIETLGSVTVICSDKTGTLTQNRMTVTALHVDNQPIDLTREDTPSGDSSMFEPGQTLLVAGIALCNDAVLERETDRYDGYHAVGDPTETALLVAAERHGCSKIRLEQDFPRITEVAFDSERKRMTTAHRIRSVSGLHLSAAHLDLLERQGLKTGNHILFSKGAVDSLLGISTQVWTQGRTEPLNAERRERIAQTNDQLARHGLRVLGVAFRCVSEPPQESTSQTIEQDLIFLGLVGMIDPLRPEVKDAVRTCRDAGIRPIMITGDHPLTAKAIAHELGILEHTDIVTGADLERVSDKDIEEMVGRVSVYARVSPVHKLSIVTALQRRGHVVAMTGDGVNDAPALKQADIGVAMGQTGTDVAKEAADMVLQDDNFATIVAAVEEGRVIYHNIRKFVQYLLSCNAGELCVMLIAPYLGMPFPLFPLQILWMNLVTDGLPALALGVEPADRDIMSRPPHENQEHMLNRDMVRSILWIGMLISVVSLAGGYWYWRTGQAHWQTIMFTTLTLSQMFAAIAVRPGRDSIFHIGFFSNRAFTGALILTFILQIAVVYAPPLQAIFKTTALPFEDLLVSFTLSSVPLWVVELWKRIGRR